MKLSAPQASQELSRNSMDEHLDAMEIEIPAEQSAFLPTLALELLNKIGSHLNDQDLYALGFVSKLLHENIKNRMGDAWLPLLKRLKEIDPHISIASPDGANETLDWQQPLFKRHFNRIARNQQVEMGHFRPYRRLFNSLIPQLVIAAKTYDFINTMVTMEKNNLWDIEDLLEMYRAAKQSRIYLETVEQTDKLLNEINISLIKGNITLNSKTLSLGRMGITRFLLTQLLDDIEFKAYFTTLEELYCQDNELQSIPDSIGELKALKSLWCGGNKLQSLPDAIVNLPALQEVDCKRNQIKALSDLIVKKLGEEWYNETLKNQDFASDDMGRLKLY